MPLNARSSFRIYSVVNHTESYRSVCTVYVEYYVISIDNAIITDRKAVSTHLPLAWTKSTAQQNEQLMAELDSIAARIKPVL